MKNSSNTIGDRTHDLPACSAVPQPTAPPGHPNLITQRLYSNHTFNVPALDECQQNITLFERSYTAWA